MQEKVIMVWGIKTVEQIMDVHLFDKPKILSSLQKNVECFIFDLPEEAEAFRIGVCTGARSDHQTFCEITDSQYRRLKRFWTKTDPIEKTG